MFNVLKFAFKVTVGLLGFAWTILVTLLECVPDDAERNWVWRSEVPYEPRDAMFTCDGKTIRDC